MMRRLLALLAFLAIAAPARAEDFVVACASLASFDAGAQALGFWQAAVVANGVTVTPAGLVTQGSLKVGSDPNASFFINYVGQVAAQTGYWARLRYNGPIPANVAAVIAAGSWQGCTIYSPFESDGVTPNPSFPSTIGVIE